MKKILDFLATNILLIISVFFLLFIPLYPKLPLFDIQHTWVNIRLEDMLIAASFLVFGIMLLFKKATLKTPLTIPILIFWLVGLISTVYSVLFIFPHLTNAFPKLAALYYLRHVEYLAVFFIGYNAIKGKRGVHVVTAALAIVTLTAFFYGVGQKFWGFPAFLTGNEEFSKGTPLELAPTARITSTFAGHYDLAGYLVLVVPIFLGVMFVVKKWWARIALLATSLCGYILLLMTASRVSFIAFLVGMSVLFVFMRKKKYIIPALIAVILISSLFDGISERLGKTISPVDLVVDARTGQTIGIAQRENGEIIVEDKTPVGDELKTGTEYINLGRENAIYEANDITFRRTKLGESGNEEEETTIEGDFIIKKGFAYDVSFTTRLQGTWPRAIKAFNRNQLTGSGYSTIGLASDNNYLRILGETGALGLASFVFVFIFFGIYVFRLLPKVKSPAVRAFSLGLSAGIVGLALNATLIDIFEASKVAFVLYFLLGLSLSMLNLYKKEKIPYLSDLKRVLTSTSAIIIYMLIASFGIYRIAFGNFFVADDFTWLRWADECKMVLQNGTGQCESFISSAVGYFTSSDGFFYRPGTKVYFHLFYSLFSMDAAKYHYVSAFLHALTGFGLFFIAKKFLKNNILPSLAAVVWIALAVHYESLFWISVTGHLICFAAIIYSLVFYIYAENRRKYFFLSLSFFAALIAPLFHEVGIVAPVLLASYHFIFSKKKLDKGAVSLIPFFLIIPAYLYLRYISASHWSGGDYSYNLVKLPFNVVGNFLGYLAVSLGGPDMRPYYDMARNYFKENTTIASVLSAFMLIVVLLIIFTVIKKVSKNTQKIILFAVLFFTLTLAPFLALGNISPRYAYLASFAPILLIFLFISNFADKLKNKTRNIGVLILLFSVVTYIGINIAQIQRKAKDWKAASVITENFLIGFYDYFPQDSEFKEKKTFYFIDTPIKYRSAWIFPTGLRDPLYFAINTDNFDVVQINEVTQDLRDKVESGEIQLFLFNKQGMVEELTREGVEKPSE